MVNAGKEFRACCMVLVLAASVLTAAAWQRSAEYDEQYTLFLTAGTPRPAWPEQAFPAGLAASIQAGRSGAASIARDLRATDVHPPLYFWIAGAWRTWAGNGQFAARLLTVGFGLGTLILVGLIAWRSRVPPAWAMLLTLGCYGFTYTSGIARSFALANMMTLLGVLWAFDARAKGSAVVAGALLGAAVLTNYLAVFAAAAVVMVHPGATGRHRLWLVGGCIPFLLAAGWFFLAQHGSRHGQFPPFEMLPAIARLAQYSAASLTGGLPLYVSDGARPWIAASLSFGIAALIGVVACRWRHIGKPALRPLFGVAACAPPLGLLLLGMVFDNTPIELRYLSFATPFLALLVAGAVQDLGAKRLVLGAVFAVQAASIAGLILRPETMQPARATAVAATASGGATTAPSSS